MDTRSGVLPPPDMPGTPWGGQAPRDIARSCRVNPTSTMKLTPQSYEHSPKKSSCAECGGAPTSTRSGSPCGSPFNQHTIEGEACLTSSPWPPRSALSCTGAGPENLKVSDVSGGTTVETVPGNPCGSSVPDNDPEHAEGRQVPNRETSGATPTVRDLTADDRPCVTSGVPRQGPPLCDSGDLSARTSRPPGMPPTGWMPLTAGFTGATSNGPSETPLPVCQARPGNIMNDVSGGYTLIAGLDRPCDGSALRDGSVPPTRIDLPSNFLEFASSPDILHQQVDEQPSAVEASTSPFHHSRLATPSSPPQHASAAPESTEVKAAPKQVRGESSSHIFREYAPAQRRVRLSPIESFVLNAATAADEQRRPRKINSCFYKTPESHSRPVETSAWRELVSHVQRVRPRATARATESNRIICIERGDSRRRAAAPAENQFLFL